MIDKKWKEKPSIFYFVKSGIQNFTGKNGKYWDTRNDKFSTLIH